MRDGKNERRLRPARSPDFSGTVHRDDGSHVADAARGKPDRYRAAHGDAQRRRAAESSVRTDVGVTAKREAYGRNIGYGRSVSRRTEPPRQRAGALTRRELVSLVESLRSPPSEAAAAPASPARASAWWKGWSG